MPTIAATLDAHLSGNDIASQISSQAGHLAAVATTIEGLVAHPPQSVGDLLGALQSFPLPDINVAGNLGTALSSLHGALPSDLASVTGPVTSGLAHLQDTLGTDLAQAFTTGLQPILDLAKLIGTDFTCRGTPPSGPGTSGSPPGPGAPAGSPPAPAGSPPATGSPPAVSGAPAAAGSPPAPSGASAAVASVGKALGLFPSPLTLDSFLAWLVTITGGVRVNTSIPVTIPILDDVHDGLETLLSWKSKQPADILADLVATMTEVATVVRATPTSTFGTLPADLAALPGAINAASLGSTLDGVASRLGELSAAIGRGDVSGTGPSVTALGALLDQYDASRAQMHAALGRLPGLSTRLQHLPIDLDGAQSRLVSFLQDSGALQAGIAAGPVPPVDQPAIDAISHVLSPAVGWLQDVAAKLDLSAVQGPLTSIATQASSAVDALDNAIATVTTQVQGLFGQVESVIDSVDVAALMGQVTTAIAGFKTEVVNQLTQLFAPIQAAVEQVVTTIGQGIDAFQPQTLVDALHKVMDSVTGVLNDPAILGAVKDITDAVQAATQQLNGLSFAPVGDEVVNEIGQVTTALKALDPSTLSPALQLALQGAVAILPHDLSFATGPIEADFDQIVDAGPGKLVAEAKAPVAALTAQVNRFSPAALIGDALSGPFNQLIATMQGFKPSSLLDPVNHELDALKARLVASASPGRLLEPLQPPFDQLLAAFDRFKPEDIVKPLQDALSSAIDTVLKAVPVQSVLDGIGAVIAKVQAVADTGNAAIAVFQQVHDLLAGLADAPAGLEAWAASIVTTVGQIADTGALTSAVAQVASSVDATKSAALLASCDAMLAPATGAIDALNPQGRLTTVVQAYRAVPASALAALPDSPQKAAVTAVVQRANPLQPAFGAPLESLAALRASITSARAALGTALATWDARYHAADGVLACLAGLQPTSANLATWLGDAATTLVVRPLRTLMALVAPAAAGLQPIVTELKALITDVAGKITALVSGPGSIGAIKTAVDALLAKLKGLNISFLSDSLKSVFADVRTKLQALSPATLKGAVDKAFADMLATLDLHQILPTADVQKLDGDFTALITKLQGLDPGKLVVAAVQPVFDATVAPLIKAFDLSAALDAVAALLTNMKGDLKAELDKVDGAYQAMIAAVPSLSPMAIVGDVVGAVGGALGGDLGGSVGGLL
jgi:phage-related protein